MGDAIKELSQSQQAESPACAELFAQSPSQALSIPLGFLIHQGRGAPSVGWNRFMRFLCPSRSVLARGCSSGVAELSLERGNAPDMDSNFEGFTCTGLETKYSKIGVWKTL